MKQLISFATTLLLLGALLPEGKAVAHTASASDQFRGSSWTLISGRVDHGGRKVLLIAPRLQGFLMFDANDHFLIVITRSRPPKFASNPGQARTLGVNKAMLQRSIACFGTYSINDAEHTINVHIEDSTFTKWTGTDQKRLFTVVGDKLKLTNSSSSGGAGTAESVWKRVK